MVDFYRATLCWARYMLSSCVCPSVCVSVTLQYCIKTAKRRITQIMVRDSIVYTDKRIVRSLCHSRASCYWAPVLHAEMFWVRSVCKACVTYARLRCKEQYMRVYQIYAVTTLWTFSQCNQSYQSIRHTLKSSHGHLVTQLTHHRPTHHMRLITQSTRHKWAINSQRHSAQFQTVLNIEVIITTNEQPRECWNSWRTKKRKQKGWKWR